VSEDVISIWPERDPMKPRRQVLGPRKSVVKLQQEREAAGNPYPLRAMSSKKWEAWVEANNPHDRGSLDYIFWTLGFYNDQGDAIYDPRRSRLEFTQRYIVRPIFVLSIVAQVVILVIRLNS
jgi:hypothetical protein